MEPIMMLLIAAIIAAIILVAFNKQQESKMSSHLYTDDVRQLYMLTTAEYKINALENQQFNKAGDGTDAALLNISEELNRITTAFERGELPLNELNARLDYLLNIYNTSMAQAY